MPNESPLLTVVQAAKYLNVGRDTVYGLIHANDFPSIKVGGTWRVHKLKLDQWIIDQLENK